MFKYIEPEVSGELGESTELDNSVHPPIVKKLHYEFEGWLGNDMIESFPCYLVTENLRRDIEKKGFSGINFSDVIITVSEEFKDLYPTRTLPNFYWMKIEGKEGVDDFGLSEDYRLVISSQVQELLSFYNLSEADFEDYS